MTNESYINEHCIIYSTFPSSAEAEKIANILLEKNLIACANILPAGKSIYKWENKIETTQEFIVFYKTSNDLYSEIEKEIKIHHSYQTPCILKIKIDTGAEEYLAWIGQNIKKP